MRQYYIIFKVVGLIGVAVTMATAQESLFTLQPPKTSGVDFRNDIKETEALNVLSYEYFYNGGGVAAGDLNNDGLIDLCFTANMKPDKLYLNLGGLKFKDITKQAKFTTRLKWKTGVSIADVNGDGLLDIYVCYSGNGETDSRRNQLFINQGNLVFSEKAKSYGLDDPSHSTQAAFFDFDRDGDLDAYLLNHSIKDFKDVELAYLKTEYDSLAGDKLYRNDNGLFKDISKEAGISGNPISFGLGITVSDVNNDGWSDIYVSNDYRENDYLYINNGNGTFSERIKDYLQHISEFSMGNDIADINNDGFTDIITLDMLPEDNRRQKLLQGPENYELYKSAVKNGFHHQFMRNMLQLNNGDGTFSEIGQLAGISNTDWSWAPLLADFDNDGFKDLFISNGYLRDYTNKDFLKYWGNYVVQKAMKMEKTVLMELVTQMPSTRTSNYIFRNNGDLTFTNQTHGWGMDQLILSNGAAYADLDNDGDLDLIVNNVNETASIYRNNAESIHKNNFLKIQIIGREPNRFGVGARIEVFYDGKKQVVEQNPVRGFQSSVSEILQVGLGKVLRVDSLVIRWPSGHTQTLTQVEINKTVRVEENAPIPVRQPLFEIAKYFTPEQPAITFLHRDYEYNDFKRQPLMFSMLSHTGPVLTKGDVNADGLEDVLIGASKGQATKLYLQRADGRWEESVNGLFEMDKQFTATDALFLDVDRDHDLDLYMTSGVYHDYEDGNVLLSDRLYLNDGTGFFFSKKTLPEMLTSKSCVRASDFDRDGDIDIFLGGRVVPGKYPETPVSYLLQNDGRGNFTDITDTVAPALRKIGMVTDASWGDLDGDGLSDLIVVGDWMPVTVLGNTGSALVNKTQQYFPKPLSGLWNVLVAEDIDGDKDIDLLAGNLGTNTQLRASEQEPAELIYKDFDANGSVDPFLCFYIQGKSYPYVTRDELLDQIYPLRKKYTSYKSYADAQLRDIFSEAEIGNAQKLKVNTLETLLFENVNGNFAVRKLPIETQFSPVYNIQLEDIDADGKKDILLFGNNNYPRLKFGKLDASYGVMLLNKGKNIFECVQQHHSGLNVKGDVRDAVIIKRNGERRLWLGVNGASVLMYKINDLNHEQ
ncbi:MAG: VCBS repeat-containing protein [Bacteroidota bacterium]